jgi:hypothetical protein
MEDIVLAVAEEATPTDQRLFSARVGPTFSI